MTDVAFVAAAYLVVLGGLGAYAVTIARRIRSARRTAAAVTLESRRDPSGTLGLTTGERAATAAGEAPDLT